MGEGGREDEGEGKVRKMEVWCEWVSEWLGDSVSGWVGG